MFAEVLFVVSLIGSLDFPFHFFQKTGEFHGKMTEYLIFIISLIDGQPFPSFLITPGDGILSPFIIYGEFNSSLFQLEISGEIGRI